MIPRYKRKSIIGIVGGLTLSGLGIVMLFARVGPPVLAIIATLGGLPAYIWGRVALARAKGHNTAIVLTAFLGLVFPLLVLLFLPDRNSHYRRRDD